MEKKGKYYGYHESGKVSDIVSLLWKKRNQTTHKQYSYQSQKFYKKWKKEGKQ